ncbi:YihY/virulence factor BrkB family protein [soil metagenome]
MSIFNTTKKLARDTVQEVMDDDVPSMAASIAYFAILSMPPLLAVLVALAGAAFGDDTARQTITGQMGDILGEDGAEQLATMIEGARDAAGGSLLGQIVGIAALVFGATGAFGQLQQSLNRAWDVEPDPEGSSIKQFITKRVLSLGMVLTIAFLMAVSLVLSSAIQILADQLGEIIGGAGWVAIRIADIGLPLVMFTLLFAAIFKVLPDARIKWKDVWVGGLVTSVLFILGKLAIGFYLGASDVGAAFGAAGSLVVILVWIYFTALLLLVGAEFTQVYARHCGKRIEPDEGAVWVVKQTRIERPKGDSNRPESDEAASKTSPKSSSSSSDEVAHPIALPREAQPRDGIQGESERSN